MITFDFKRKNNQSEYTLHIDIINLGELLKGKRSRKQQNPIILRLCCIEREAS